MWDTESKSRRFTSIVLQDGYTGVASSLLHGEDPVPDRVFHVVRQFLAIMEIINIDWRVGDEGRVDRPHQGLRVCVTVPGEPGHAPGHW